MLPASQTSEAGGQGQPKWELADIFRSHGESYRRAHRLPLSHLKVMRAVEVCRTKELGGHLKKCDTCLPVRVRTQTGGFEHPTYNSCLNRHCPKCQAMAKAKWLKKQTSELLPTGYFHLVFTLPHELNWLILSCKKLLLSLLFKAVSETLLEFGATHLKGTLGIIAILHTWDQTLKDHFHLHCLIPAGALSFDQSRWVACRKDFLFHVKALSLVFRGKFLDSLERAFDQGKLKLPGPIVSLANEKPWKEKLRRLRKKKWVVYANKPFGSPEKVLDYLGRYTHRVAISNNRILCAKDGQVTFTYRDRKDKDRLKTMTLPAQEFIRRFLLHVLPEGFVRVRHFGFLANLSACNAQAGRAKKRALPQCRKLLGLNPALPEIPKKSPQELMLELTGTDISRCPRCKQGTMVIVAELPKLCPWDSS